MTQAKTAPQYQAIYESLRERILSGYYSQGTMLPFERELVEQYAAQRITVRHALDLLVKSGLIIKKPGVGSFVAPHPLDAVRTPARHDTSGERKIVHFLMARNSNDIKKNSFAYNSHLFFFMEQACRAAGMTLLFTSALDADEARGHVAANPPACVMLVSHIPPAIRQYLLDLGVPITVLNSIDPRAMSVMPDNAGGVALAMEELFALGHRRIGFVGGPELYVNARERRQAYRLALLNHGLAEDSSWIRGADWTSDGGESAMRGILDLPKAIRPTAVLAASDMMAFGACRAIQGAGLRIGQDVSVMGFDNVPMCDIVTPRLTTIDVDPERMTQVAMKHTLAAVRGDTAPIHVARIPASLVRRDSCGPCLIS